jgi:hypothetical protein
VSFTEFCENMLIALYQDGHVSDDFLSFEDLQRKYGIEGDRSWLSRSMNHLRAQRRIDGREIAGAPETVLGKISGSGMAYIEEKYGSKDGVGTILEPVQSTRFGESGENQSQLLQVADTVSAATANEVTLNYQPPTVVNSSRWTGLPSGFTFSEDKLQTLVRELDRVEAALGTIQISQQERSQARAYIVAARVLAEAPEPPSDLIWEIIVRANSIAGIASLFVAIVGLFV